MSIKVKQRDVTDCGAACLASVAAHYNLEMPVSRIRQLAGTDKKGTNILGMVEAAGKMGFLAKGVKGEWDSIFKIPKPAIAHVIVKNVLHHYVVLTRTTDMFIEIMDPADGELHKLTHDQFKQQWTGVLVIITPGEKFIAENEKVTLSNRLWNLIKLNKTILFITLACSLAFSVSGLAMSIYVGKLVDKVLPDGNVSLLNLLGFAMVIVILFRFSINYLQSVLVLKSGQKIDSNLILGYYQHLLKLPQSFFDNMRTGEIISRINDAAKIRLFVNEVIINLMLNIFILVVSFVIMCSFDWKLALVILTVLPAYTIIYFISDRLNKKAQLKVMERAADLEAHFVESLNSAGTLKRFGLEDFSNSKTEKRFNILLREMYKSGLNSVFSSNSTSLVSQLMTVIVLWTGAGFVIKAEITSGELLTFYSVIGYFTIPITSIMSFNRILQDALIAADRLFEIFDLKTEDLSNKIELKSGMTGDIKFDKVKFRYGTRVKVFDSLNLIIKKGEITAITGESGSGKTTLISLLQNIYPVNSGQIAIGNIDIQNITTKSLRRIVSVVPQKIDLFSGSVAENIALGESDPDMSLINEICEKLGMTDFIGKLPNGYNTYLGENGAALSGGQIQRIAIARALYRNPEILILDEATSSLDFMSEQFVRNTINLLKEEKKTIIVIAHRLATLKMAQRVIVLHNGEVVQDGSFNELVKADGLFKNMWAQQIIEN